ncbi:MAG: cytidine deaminase [Acidobacteriota bacterium]|jgi:cytidine deaminase
MDWEPLVEAALAVRERAHAAYSGYRVGAALLFEDGEIVSGCNVENRLPSLAVCAERVAMVRAVTHGHLHPSALVVATVSRPPAAPCGLCLETLAEFVEDLPILLVNLDGAREEVRMTDLLTRRFKLPSH